MLDLREIYKYLVQFSLWRLSFTKKYLRESLWLFGLSSEYYCPSKLLQPLSQLFRQQDFRHRDYVYAQAFSVILRKILAAVVSSPTNKKFQWVMESVLWESGWVSWATQIYFSEFEIKIKTLLQHLILLWLFYVSRICASSGPRRYFCHHYYPWANRSFL